MQTTNFSWIALETEKLGAATNIYENYGLDIETIEYALDNNELAHMEYNPITQSMTLIFKVLDLEKNDDKGYYETIPMTFILEKHRLISISRPEQKYVLNYMNQYLMSHESVSANKFLFAVLEFILHSYYPLVERLDKTKDQLNQLLREETSKKNLLLLSDLETALIYLVAATKQNKWLLDNLKSHSFYHSLDKIDKEQFEDAAIEAKQLLAMTELQLQVLNQLSISYNNILNNTLNVNLSNLTIFEVILSILAVITGFYGMNVALPFMESEKAWIYIVVVSIILWLIIAQILKRQVKKR